MNTHKVWILRNPDTGQVLPHPREGQYPHQVELITPGRSAPRTFTRPSSANKARTHWLTQNEGPLELHDAEIRWE